MINENIALIQLWAQCVECLECLAHALYCHIKLEFFLTVYVFGSYTALLCKSADNDLDCMPMRVCMCEREREREVSSQFSFLLFQMFSSSIVFCALVECHSARPLSFRCFTGPLSYLVSFVLVPSHSFPVPVPVF